MLIKSLLWSAGYYHCQPFTIDLVTRYYHHGPVTVSIKVSVKNGQYKGRPVIKVYSKSHILQNCIKRYS